MDVKVEAMPVPALTQLVNGWGTMPRTTAAERPCPPLASFRAPAADGANAEATEAALQRVADLVFPVFAATDAADRARLVTDLLARSGVRPALSSVGEHIAATWLVEHERDAILAAAAVTLHAQLVAHPDRIGTCAAHGCADAYVDASPAGHRRFCSITCQNRARIAAFRRRKSARG